MLRTLSIRNFALIDQLELDFGSGLNVLTGETGAGKSILMGALELVLGARASSDVVRAGAKRAEIQAVFAVGGSVELAGILDRHGIELDEDEIILSRTVSSEGRSKAYAEGQLVPASALAEIAAELVDLHGQHEHQSLLRADRQLALLDAFGELSELRGRVEDRVRALRAVDAEIEALDEDGREPQRRLDFLRFEAEEIDRAKIRSGEDDELKERRDLLANSERIWTNVGQALNRLSESDAGDAAIEALSAALGSLEAIAEFHPDLAAIADRLRAAIADVESVAYDLAPFGEQEDFDPDELNAINTRLSQLRDLKRKYGESIDDVLAYRAKIESEIGNLTNRDQVLEELRQKRGHLEAECREHAASLTKKRRTAVKRLDKQVTESLQDLGMQGARLTTDIAEAPLSSSGVDRVEFRLAANPGEPAKPLRQVASGGEISRIMLALKSVFAQADAVPTLIFDEIDAGVGGQVATRVAQRLRELAVSHQVLCITHLAQIAAAGENHFHVAKTMSGGKTTTQVVRVESKTRVEELARLLDGSVTQVSLTHAEDLLRKLAG